VLGEAKTLPRRCARRASVPVGNDGPIIVPAAIGSTFRNRFARVGRRRCRQLARKSPECRGRQLAGQRWLTGPENVRVPAAFFSAAGIRSRGSGVYNTANHEFTFFVNLFPPFVVLLHETTVNQVRWPGGPHECRTRAMLSRRWGTNEQLTCTGCFAYAPANTAPVHTLRL